MRRRFCSRTPAIPAARGSEPCWPACPPLAGSGVARGTGSKREGGEPMNNTDSKPWWQQATALVTVSASGAITGFNFVPAAAAATTPASVPLHLLALEQAALPDTAGKTPASDGQLRAAIVNVAGYYLKLAKTKTPA